MNSVVIRHAESHYLNAITNIYAHEVLHGLASFEAEPPDTQERGIRRQSVLDKGLPYLVATIDDSIVGYCYASPYRARAAYQNTLENSVYVHKDARQRGIGSVLLNALIEHCEQGPWRQMIAVIADSENTGAGSYALHTRCGFRHIGTIEAVGYKFNQWIDTTLLQRALSDGSKSNPA